MPVPVVYKLGPITSDHHYPVSWKAIQSLMNGHWPLSEHDRSWAIGKKLILSCYWQCPETETDARVIVNLSTEADSWDVEVVELSARIDRKWVKYSPVEVEIDNKTVLSISIPDCFTAAKEKTDAVEIVQSITGTLDHNMVAIHGATPGKTVERYMTGSGEVLTVDHKHNPINDKGLR